jgi:hypothetical protein
MGAREDFFDRRSAEEKREARKAAQRKAADAAWSERILAERARRRAEIDEMAREAEPPPWWLR